MKVQSPIIGRARGSAGGMTFCKNYNKNVARAKAFEVSNPNTQAQQTQRAFFASLTALVMDFSDEQLRTLFPNKPKTMSRRNALSKQIAGYNKVDGNVKLIDFDNIDTLGNAPVTDFGEISIYVEPNNIQVGFEELASLHAELENNDMMFALINESKSSIKLILTDSTVSDGSAIIDYPDGWSDDDNIHSIPFVLNTKNGTSTTVGFGTMFVVCRPPRKND